MTQSANYNVPQTRIFVDPPELYETGVKVLASGENIVTETKQITDIWADLKLGWAGDTATEAADFIARWTRTAHDFFGAGGGEGDGGKLANIAPGVLTKVVMAIQLAASNYDRSEDFVVKMFDEFAAALTKNDGGGDPDVHRDFDLGPIKENSQGEKYL